jgi:hypothetical protein
VDSYRSIRIDSIGGRDTMVRPPVEPGPGGHLSRLVRELPVSVCSDFRQFVQVHKGAILQCPPCQGEEDTHVPSDYRVGLPRPTPWRP